MSLSHACGAPLLRKQHFVGPLSKCRQHSETLASAVATAVILASTASSSALGELVTLDPVNEPNILAMLLLSLVSRHQFCTKQMLSCHESTLFATIRQRDSVLDVWVHPFPPLKPVGRGILTFQHNYQHT